MEQQKKQGMVAITVSWPALESAKRNYSMSDVTVDLACLRVDGAGGGGGSAVVGVAVSTGVTTRTWRRVLA